MSINLARIAETRRVVEAVFPEHYQRMADRINRDY